MTVKTTEYDVAEIDNRLRQLKCSVLRSKTLAEWVLVPESGKPAIELSVYEDTARVIYGRIAVALSSDEDNAVDTLIALIGALLSGGAQEIFGYQRDGHFGFLGHEITYESRTFRRIDEGVIETIRIDM